MPSQFTVTGSPLTSDGTITVTLKSTSTIPSTQDWTSVYNAAHTHGNQSVLDGITSTKVSHWDEAYDAIDDFVTLDTTQTITGEKTFSSKPVHIGSTSGIDVNGSSYIDIGDARLVWDSNTHSLHITKRPGSSYSGNINVYADGDVGAGGPGSGSSVKYVNCANQSAYNNISTKDPATIYTIGTAPSFSRIYLGTILIYGS
jgi:hypothetical protein